MPPAARLIQSPFDLDARYSYKREREWMGYKVHLTETCDEHTPNLITHVLTTNAHRTRSLMRWNPSMTTSTARFIPR